MNKKYEIIYKYQNRMQLLKDTIQGEFNRICVTDSEEELKKCTLNALEAAFIDDSLKNELRAKL